MKKTVFIVFIFACSLAMLFSKEVQREGWVNNNTFRVTGVGTIGPEHEGHEAGQRRILACEAAQLHAEGQLIEKLAHAGIRSVKGTVNESSFKDGIRKKFSGTIRGGRIVYKAFDPETNACEVVYEIQEKNLKKKVTALARQKR